jgi:hypothetical protein
MATLSELARSTLAPNGQSFDQGIAQVIGSNQNLKSDLGTGSFGDMSESTRQLIAENAATQIGDKSLIQSEAAKRFISGDYGGGASGTGPSTVQGGGSVTQGQGTFTPEVVPNTSGTAGDSLTSMIESRYGSLLEPGLSEAEILAQEEAAIQNQVNALNQIYVNRTNEAQREGYDRLGRGRSLNALSGTAYSPFGEARTQGIERQNSQVIDAINAEKAAELANLYAAARGEATRKVEYQSAQLAENTNAYIDQMVNAYSLSQDEAESLRNEAARIAQLTGYYNGQATLDRENSDFSQNMDLRSFLASREDELAGREQTNRQIDMQAEELRRSGYQVDQMADGTVGYWDYSSGTPRFTSIGNYAKAATGSGSGYGADIETAALSAYFDKFGTLPAANQRGVVTDLYARSMAQQGLGQAFNQALPNSPLQNPSIGPTSYYQAYDPFAAAYSAKTAGSGSTSDFSSLIDQATQ